MEDEKLPITEHLGELRRRIVISLITLFIGFLISFNFSQEIFNILIFPLKYNLTLKLQSPYLEFVPQDKLEGTKLVFLAPAEALWMSIKISLVSAIIVGIPIFFHQAWKFISPGLLPHEKKYLVPFLFSSISLFLIGVSFCFFIVLPFAISFLLDYRIGDVLVPMLSVGMYIDFCLKFILAFGVIFELPIVIVFLTKLGIVTPQFLAKNRKYAILIAFILAAVLTPTPDAFNQTLMAFPIIVLYEVGIGISKIFSRKKST
ncbi:MAG: twin-arginine translocase subunit TatC [Thermodesulfovibrionales bacterium]|nr:twin-arginine translocase subunit TatC [Thermodesulfovibrionales bacterium]